MCVTAFWGRPYCFVKIITNWEKNAANLPSIKDSRNRLLPIACFFARLVHVFSRCLSGILEKNANGINKDQLRLSLVRRPLFNKQLSHGHCQGHRFFFFERLYDQESGISIGIQTFCGWPCRRSSRSQIRSWLPGMSWRGRAQSLSHYLNSMPLPRKTCTLDFENWIILAYPGKVLQYRQYTNDFVGASTVNLLQHPSTSLTWTDCCFFFQSAASLWDLFQLIS